MDVLKAAVLLLLLLVGADAAPPRTLKTTPTNGVLTNELLDTYPVTGYQLLHYRITLPSISQISPVNITHKVLQCATRNKTDGLSEAERLHASQCKFINATMSLVTELSGGIRSLLRNLDTDWTRSLNRRPARKTIVDLSKLGEVIGLASSADVRKIRVSQDTLAHRLSYLRSSIKQQMHDSVFWRKSSVIGPQT